MHDMSDRFLFQLMADHRESLQRSGRTAARRPLRRALRAGLARLGLASVGPTAGDRPTDRGRAHGHGGSDTLIGDPPTASRQVVGTSPGDARGNAGREHLHREVPS